MKLVNYSKEEFFTYLNEQLEDEFYDAQFFYVELRGILQGIVNSLRWSALRCALENNESNEAATSKDILMIRRNFANQWMKETEIIDRIKNTSGVNSSVARYALKAIYRLVLENINLGNRVRLPAIGVIEHDPNTDPKELTLFLDKALKSQPRSGVQGAKPKVMSATSSAENN